LSIKAATVWLPPDRETADSEISPSDIEAFGVRELPVATDVAPPQMAVLAAKSALENSRADPASIGYLVHAYVYHQGFDMWSPAHYIANQARTVNALPVNVQQLCNGGPLALHLASTWLAATPDASAALVTTADRFCLPGFNRWASDDEAVYGDSAAALVLGRRGGDGDLLHLLALEMGADPEWEIQLRGDDEFSPAPLWHSSSVDLRRPNNAFRESGAAARMAKVGLEKLHEIFLRTLHKANVEPTDIRCVALPRLSRQMRENVFMPAIGLLLERHPVYLPCHTGCLGAGDFLANMIDMTDSLNAGDIGLLIQGGGGFTFSCAIVQAPVY
jgi:3-oxoacyl-[acyl-carrier-protein] synthase-3